ncbi:MAG: O-antigen ligase family protein [Pseudomonadota bacterium]
MTRTDHMVPDRYHIPSDWRTRRDYILVSLWFILTFKSFRYDELLLYPMALYFCWAFIRDFQFLFPIVWRSLILFAFPTWWMLTAFWGEETFLIIRSGLQLFLGIMICYCAALRTDPRHIVLSIFAPGSYWAIMSLLAASAGGVAARGAYPSKNSMGQAMVVVWMCVLCIVLDRGFPGWLRAMAACVGVLAMYLIFLSNSATAVLLMLGVTGIVLFYAVVLRRRWLSSRVVIGGFLLLCGASVSVFGFLMIGAEFDPVGMVLEAFGKDRSLTGRTVLWEYAEEQIRQNPFLGVGEGGFWTPRDGLSLSARIFEEFHKAPNALFTFHNSYYEIAVHQGLIGVAIAVLAIGWAVLRTVYEAHRQQTVVAAFFICATAVNLVRSTTEAGVLGAFSLVPTVMLIGALFSVKQQVLTAGSSARTARPMETGPPLRPDPVGLTR